MINLGTSTMQDFALGDNLVECIDLGDTTIFDPYTTLTGTLPLSFNSRVAGALKNYRLYGTSAGSGTPTESGEPAGYKIPILLTDGTSTSNYDLFIGDSKLYEDEYLDFVEQKVYKKKPNLVSGIIQNVSVNSSGQLVQNPALNGAVTPIEQGKTYTILYARSSGSSSNMICGFFENYPVVGATTYDGFRLVWNTEYHSFIAPIDGYLVSSYVNELTNPVVYEGEYPQLAPTDPPAPLPPIPTYKGENTLSSTETLGEVTVKGRISEISPTP